MDNLPNAPPPTPEAQPNPLFDLFKTLKAKHPTAERFDALGKTFICRRPTRIEYKRMRELISADQREKAGESLLVCVLYPDQVVLDSWFEELPALEGKLPDEIAALAGSRAAIEKKAI